jgi:hypothetical protein
VEEELLDLQGVQVSVVMECLEDGDIALGQGAEEKGGFLLSEVRELECFLRSRRMMGRPCMGVRRGVKNGSF